MSISSFASAFRTKTGQFFQSIGKINMKVFVVLLVLISFIAYVILYFDMKKQTCVFVTVSIPDTLKKQGYTEDHLINTVTDFVSRIKNYERPLRDFNVPTTTANITKLPFKSSLSNEEIKNLTSMNVEITPLGMGFSFMSIMYVTDRVLMAMGIPVNDNYAEVELFIDKDQLCMGLEYKRKRQVLDVCCFEDSTLKESYTELCYQVAAEIIRENDPVALAGFYFNVYDYDKCMMTCVDVLSGTVYNKCDVKEAQSRAYLYWGLSLMYMNDSIDVDDHIKEKFKKAIDLDPDNEYAQLLLKVTLADNIKESVTAIDELVKENKKAYTYRLMQLIYKAYAFDTIPNEKKTAVLAGQCYDSMKQLYNLILTDFVKCGEKKYPSDLHYQFGNYTRTYLAQYKNELYDSSVALFQKAIEQELTAPERNIKSISEYYNATAFIYELKAFQEAKLDIKKCSFDSMDANSTNLNNTYFFSKQAVLMNPHNYWAYSTLGEYYAIQYLIDSDETKNLDSCFSTWRKAVINGFDLDSGIQGDDAQEPYISIGEINPSKFKSTAQKDSLYYSGAFKNLKYLEVLP